MLEPSISFTESILRWYLFKGSIGSMLEAILILNRLGKSRFDFQFMQVFLNEFQVIRDWMIFPEPFNEESVSIL